MHINDLDKDYFKEKGLKPDGIRSQLAAVNYIRTTATNTKIQLGKIEIDKLMHAGKVITNKQKINEYLFNLRTKANKKRQIKQDVAIQVVTKLQDFFGPMHKEIKADLKKSESNAKRFKTLYEKNKTDKNFEKMQKWERLRDDLTNRYNYKDMAKKIIVSVNSGYLEFTEIKALRHPNEYELTFITPHDITLTEINHQAGLNLSKNVGQFKIKVVVGINLRNGKLMIHNYGMHIHKNNWGIPYDGRPKANKIVHPYINDLQLCEGNTYRPIRDARREGNLPYMLQMVYAAISTYSSAGGPWCTLTDFIARAKPFKQKKEKKVKETLIDVAISLAEEAEDEDYGKMMSSATQREEFYIERSRTAHEEEYDEDYEEDDDDW